MFLASGQLVVVIVDASQIRYINGRLVEDDISYDPFFLQYKTTRYPTDGIFWSTHITLYDQLQKRPRRILDYYQAFEKAAIKAATFILENHSSLPSGSRRASVGARPARLVRDMDDETALNVFGYVRSILTGGGFKITEGPVFKEQVVLGVLIWLLDNWRVAFDGMEQFLTDGMRIKEYLPVCVPSLATVHSANVLYGNRKVDQLRDGEDCSTGFGVGRGQRRSNHRATL